MIATSYIAKADNYHSSKLGAPNVNLACVLISIIHHVVTNKALFKQAFVVLCLLLFYAYYCFMPIIVLCLLLFYAYNTGCGKNVNKSRAL